MRFNNYLVFIILLTVSFNALACSEKSATAPGEQYPFEAPSDTVLDPFTVNERLGRGINMGNALEAPAEGDWGVTIKENYFTEIKNAGFQSVRIPIRWNAHALADSPFTIDPVFLSRVDQVIRQALENDLALIINIHHYTDIFSEPEAQRSRFLSIWAQLAEHYKKYPDRVVFEILNEPHDQLTAEIWNDFLAEAIQVIRLTNPYRTLMIGMAEWGGIAGLNKLVIPDEEKNVIVTTHYYNPFHFTHQGAEWTDGSDAWLGTTWTGTQSEKNAVVSDFGAVVSWAQAHHRPINMGEFGAYSKADMASRVRWTSYIARQAENFGWSWHYWEFCSGFGAYDPSTDTWRTELLNALIPQ